MKGKLILAVLLLWVVSGCSGLDESTETKTHRFMEHAGIDWFNF